MQTIDKISKGSNPKVTKLSRLIESQTVLWGSIIIGFVLILVSAFLYGYNRNYFVCDSEIDNDLLGTYGDFIGGTVGVILTFIGTILLYRTLKNQIESNNKTINASNKQLAASRKANNLTSLQIFDSNFQMLFGQYRKTLDSYKNERGDIITLRDIYQEYYSDNNPLNQEWTRRSSDAVQKYEDIYTKYRENMSVHFRMLYLIFKLIHESAPEDTKVMYAKLVRGQMTDSELLLLRYNCMSSLGKKMQNYVNKYNLIKHLPFMEMLEAKKHKDIINDGELSNAINILVVSLKKWLSTDFYNPNDFSIIHNVTDNVTISFETSENHCVLCVTITFPKPVMMGGGMKRPAIERALAKFEDQQLEDFGIDMMQELMRFSNFNQYSTQEGPTITNISNSNGKHSLKLTYQSSSKIFMTQAQKESEPSKNISNGNMIKSKYAPIIIFAFNRLESLKATVSSIIRNTEAAESDLFVFVDGAREHKEGEKVKVLAVQEYVKTISGFKSLTYTFSEKNKGLGPSIIAGVTEVIRKYGSVIVLEDDLIVARGFLNYMNTMLEAYKHDSRIMQISGFSTKHYTPKNYKYDIYLNRRGESWSWATWVDRWNMVDWEVKDYSTLLQDRRQQREFNDIGSDLFGMLKGCMEGRNKSWAVRFCYTMFKKGMYAVSPIKSLVRNEGFDENATNCKTSYNRFKYIFNDEQTIFTPISNIPYLKSIDKSANRYWSIQYRVFGKLMSFFK